MKNESLVCPKCRSHYSRSAVRVGDRCYDVSKGCEGRLIPLTKLTAKQVFEDCQKLSRKILGLGMVDKNR